MKILILSISPESSHGRVAMFIKEYIERAMCDCIVKVIDNQNYINPVVDKLIQEGYLIELRKSRSKPCIPGDSSEKEDVIEGTSDILKGLLVQKLENHIGEFNPDVIITTHPSYLKTLSLIKDEIALAPVVGVITNFDIPDCWLSGVVDAYIIPHEDLIAELYHRGVPLDKVFPLGIPVSGEFLNKVDRMSILKELGLANKLTILIMREVIGPGTVYNILKYLPNYAMDPQLIIISGNQRGIKAANDNIIKDYGKKVKVLGYDKLSDAMSVSDLLITKPDSLTVSESMIKRLPIALLSSNCEQKSKALVYLLKKGAVAKLDYCENISGQISSILSNKHMLEQIRANAALMAKPQAASDIACLIASYKK